MTPAIKDEASTSKIIPNINSAAGVALRETVHTS